MADLRCQNKCDKKLGVLSEVKRMPVTRRVSFVRVEINSWVWGGGCSFLCWCEFL